MLRWALEYLRMLISGKYLSSRAYSGVLSGFLRWVSGVPRVSRVSTCSVLYLSCIRVEEFGRRLHWVTPLARQGGRVCVS